MFPKLFYEIFKPPREMGIPYRFKVHSFDEMEKIAIRHSGKRDVFVALYNTHIDKILFDIDSLDLNIVKRLYRYLSEYGPVIPVFTGRGFHLLLLIRPSPIYKKHLKVVQYGLIDDCGLYYKESDKKIALLDTCVFGDVRRMTRVPNVRRRNQYCVWLPEYFIDMSLESIIEYSKKPQFPEYRFGEPKYTLLDLYDMVDKESIFDYMSIHQLRDSEVKRSKKIDVCDDFIKFVLPKILPPCLYNAILTEDPSHEVRTAATIILLMSFSPDEIVEIYSKIGWKDFNENITRYQVEYLAKKCLKPYSCRKLKQMGLCVSDGLCEWKKSILFI